jgi:uncharacterized membrane protein YcaP (DUF421 family)
MHIDWHGLFALSPLGLFIRGSVVYWFLFAIFRVVLRRDIGKIVYRNLRREWITEDDLRAKLREQGVATLSEVRAAYMEANGAVTVITRGSQQGRRRGATRRRPGQQ